MKKKAKNPVPEPKPCPFCGAGDPECVRGARGFHLECRQCFAQGPYVEGGDLREAVDQWNRRAPDA